MFLKTQPKAKAPCVVHQDLSFIQRVFRDITDEDVDEIVLDSKENLKEAEKFVQKFLPSMKGKFKFYSEEAYTDI
jgi:ribonuclease G